VRFFQFKLDAGIDELAAHIEDSPVAKVEPPGMGDPYRYFYATPPNPVFENVCFRQYFRREKSSAGRRAS
jgi:hypothetical protein